MVTFSAAWSQNSSPMQELTCVSEKDVTEKQFAQAVTGLRALCDLAPEIRFALETHPGPLMESSAGTLRLLQVVQRQNLRVNLQIPVALNPRKRAPAWARSAICTSGIPSPR